MARTAKWLSQGADALESLLELGLHALLPCRGQHDGYRLYTAAKPKVTGLSTMTYQSACGPLPKSATAAAAADSTPSVSTESPLDHHVLHHDLHLPGLTSSQLHLPGLCLPALTLPGLHGSVHGYIFEQ